MKYRRVRISSERLIGMFITDREFHIRVKEGLPKGTKFIHLTSNQIYGVDIVVEHESFDSLKDGDTIPLHPNLLFEDIRGEKK